MRTRIQNSAGSKGDVSILFDFARNGKSERTFSKTIQLTGSPEQVVDFSEKWENPVLWDAEQPNLYQMTVSLLQNGKVADTFPVKDFGFREAWVEKGGFRMNGKNMRMRMWSSPGLDRLQYYYGNPQAVGQYVAHIKSMNYDTVRMDPYGKHTQISRAGYFRESNRQGLYNLVNMPPYEDENREEYAEGVIRFLEHYGNHPSILMWFTDFNTCSYPWNQDPAKLNDLDYVPSGSIANRKRASLAEKMMREFDSSREIFQHAGGNSGKIFGSMNYQSFGTPLQEQEDWPEQWARKPALPLMVVESAFPYPGQYSHFDNEDLGSLAAEHAARYFGDSAFSGEDRPIPNATHWLSSPYAKWNQNSFRLGSMLYSKVVKAWRAYNMSALGDFPGERDMARTAKTYNNHNVVYDQNNHDVKTLGLKPDNPIGSSETQSHLLTDYSRPDGLVEVIRDAFKPLLVFLGGMTSDFTNKDHAFYAGEKFEKSAVVVNDHLTPQTLEFRWTLSADGKQFDQGRFSATVEAGGIAKLPIILKAPDVSKRTEAELRLTALQKENLLKEDVVALQFFPKRVQPDFRDVSAGLYDPEGKTETVLKKAGFPYRKVQSLEELKGCRLLILGQNALSHGNPEFLKQLEMAGLIEKGLKILIFEQKQCNLGNLVFESPSYRNAFIRRPDSPYLTGLKEVDLSNWRGASDTVPAYVLSEEKSPHYPRSKWKCGNGGIVSGNVIRKPSYGNFTTIVDSGFNLMFASLLELRKGHGLILFCQLDATSRYGKDPAATLLVDNLLKEMGNRFVPVGPQRVGYLGDEAGEELLRKMGMEFSRVPLNSLWSIYKYQVLILGKNAVPDQYRQAFRKQMQNPSFSLIVLPGAPLEFLSEKIKWEKKSVFRASLPKDDPVFAGIPDADLYFREARELPVLTGLPDWAVVSTPALYGKLDFVATTHVFLSVAPNEIAGLWNEEKIARVWNAIFNNMNIGLGKDLKLFCANRMRHNTIGTAVGEALPESCGLRLDPSNTGKVDDPAGFKPIQLGKTWEEQGWQQPNPHHQYPPNTSKNMKQPYDGYAWIRATVRIPESWKGCRVSLVGGPIDDCDWTYWNGVKIGETTFDNAKDSYRRIRNYRVPDDKISFGGENTLMIKVFDRWGGGGVTGPLKVIAEKVEREEFFSPYIQKLDFYDGDAFHNW